jgi:hypothetical protein
VTTSEPEPRKREDGFVRRTGLALAVLGTALGVATIIALYLVVASLHRG